jgi:hypothetical protein
MIQDEHDVQNSLISEDFMTNICADEHEIIFILKDGSSEVRPDH